jgi:hypothetical protein
MTREKLLQVVLADGAYGFYDFPFKDLDNNPHPNGMLDPRRSVELLSAYDAAPFLRSKRDGIYPSIGMQDDVVIQYMQTPEAMAELEANLTALRTYAFVTLDKLLVHGASGRLGLVSKRVKLGDVVCILHGSKTPVILRQYDEEENLFEVVGQCYWEDCMYGEAVDWKESEAREYILV